MKHHSELLNWLIRKHNLKSYCEIGTFNRAHNFDLIQVERKFCIDPDPNAKADFIGTSDAFFDMLDLLKPENSGYDLFWIDGLHHSDQVKKDFENALRYLNPGGFICLHDMNPPTEKTTCIPRGNQREWCGDTYQFGITMRQYKGIRYCTVDMDYGCMVCWRDETQTEVVTAGFMNWERFDKNRKHLLNLVSVGDFINEIEV